MEEIGEQLIHGQFVDDTHVILEAKRSYIDATFNIFRMMEQTFGIFVKEIGVKAIHISNAPLPPKSYDMKWNWETEGNLTKLLEIFMGVEIFSENM